MKVVPSLMIGVVGIVAGVLLGIAWRSHQDRLNKAERAGTVPNPPNATRLLEPKRADLGSWVSTTIDHVATSVGTHAAYTVTVHADGSVHYQGGDHARVRGNRVLALGTAATRTVEQFSRPFLEMQAGGDVYQYPMAHMPETVVTVVTTTMTRVIHCHVLEWSSISFMKEETVLPDYVREFWALFSSSLDAIEEVSGVKPLAGEE